MTSCVNRCMATWNPFVCMIKKQKISMTYLCSCPPIDHNYEPIKMWQNSLTLCIKIVFIPCYSLFMTSCDVFCFFSSHCLTCLKVIFDSQLNCEIDLITIFGVPKLNENSSPIWGFCFAWMWKYMNFNALFWCLQSIWKETERAAGK